MSDPLFFRCEMCGVNLKTPPSRVGQSWPCPKCKATLTVPGIRLESPTRDFEYSVAAGAKFLGAVSESVSNLSSLNSVEEKHYKNAVLYASIVSTYTKGCAYIAAGVVVLFLVIMLMTTPTVHNMPSSMKVLVMLVSILYSAIALAAIIVVACIALLSTSVVFLLADIHRRQCGIELEK